MAAFVVSNRPLKKAGTKFIESGRTAALASFRVATLDCDAKTYAMTPDWDGLDFERAAKPRVRAASLRGSERIVHEVAKPAWASEAPSDLVLLVHGFDYDLSESIDQLHRVTRPELYGPGGDPKGRRPQHLVYFSWPSGTSIRPKDYRIAKRRVERSGEAFARLVRHLLQGLADVEDRRGPPKRRPRIRVVAHSMGNQVLAAALDHLHDLSARTLDDVLLLNADVSYKALEKGGSLRPLGKLARRVHVYYHRSDDVLRLSSRMNRNIAGEKPRRDRWRRRTWKDDHERLGRHGPKSMLLAPRNVRALDTTNAKGERGSRELRQELRMDHWGYLHRPAIIEDVAKVLSGRTPRRRKTRKDRTFLVEG